MSAKPKGHSKHRWVHEYSDYKLVPKEGFVIGPHHYVCAYCPKKLVTSEPIKSEFKFDVVRKVG